MLQWARYTLALATVAVPLAGCGSELAVGPGDSEPMAVTVQTAAAVRTVDLGACGYLSAPEGSTLVFHAYARGAQVELDRQRSMPVDQLVRCRTES